MRERLHEERGAHETRTVDAREERHPAERREMNRACPARCGIALREHTVGRLLECVAGRK